MNKKMIYILATLFIVLLAVSYIQKGFDRATGTPETLDELKLSFDPDSVTGINVFKQHYPDSGLHFQKLETDWVVASEYNAPAKQSDVQKLIDDLRNASGSVRGESADLFADFEITDEKALQIEFYDSARNKLLHLYVGKGGGTGRECFIRLAGSPKIYLAGENFISRFAAWNAPPERKLPADRWLELKLYDIDRNNMTSIRILKGKTAFEFANVEIPSEDTLSAPSKAWIQISPEKGSKLEESKIRGLASAISGLRAKGVVDPAFKDQFGLSNPRNIIRAGDMTGKEAEIAISDPVNVDEERYVIVKGRDSVYKIDKSTFERLLVEPFKTNK